jgi:hypothetical protein
MQSSSWPEKSASKRLWVVIALGVAALFLFSTTFLENEALGSLTPAYSGSTAPLNYLAYHITSNLAEVTLLYSFPSMNGSATLDLSNLDFGPLTFNTLSPSSGSALGSTFSSVGWQACGNPCNGLYIEPLQATLNYGAFLNASAAFRIKNTNPSLSGIYLFYPPDGRCFNLVLIIGNQIPSQIPSSFCSGGPPSFNAFPWPNISVIGMQNITGLNITIAP